MRRHSWRAYLHPADPDYEDPADQECDADPPDQHEDLTHLGPPEYEGTAAYRHPY